MTVLMVEFSEVAGGVVETGGVRTANVVTSCDCDTHAGWDVGDDDSSDDVEMDVLGVVTPSRNSVR